MAHDVKIRFKSFLPGGGYDSSGNPVQGKTRVVGIVDVTSYDGEEGDQFDARSVGLTNIDALTLRVRDQMDGSFPGAKNRDCLYSQSTGHFYLLTRVATGVALGVVAGSTETLEFDAFGDSVADVELT